MLSKTSRLTKEEFNTVYDTGKNIPSQIGYFKVVRWDKKTKVSCVASKKAARKSVGRTRIRRRGYAAIAAHQATLPENYGIIWFLPQSALEIDFSYLKKAAQKMINSLDNV